MSSLNLLTDPRNTLTQEPSHVEGLFEPIQVPFANDDIIESSQRYFYQTRAVARRINLRRIATGLNLGNQTEVPFFPHNVAISTNLEAGVSVELQHAQNSPETNQEVQEPVIEDIEPEKEVSCPICLDSFVEEMATKCGHIFCKSCIKKAIKRRPAKCPVCRQKITSRGLRRVFLPF